MADGKILFQNVVKHGIVSFGTKSKIALSNEPNRASESLAKSHLIFFTL